MAKKGSNLFLIIALLGLLAVFAMYHFGANVPVAYAASDSFDTQPEGPAYPEFFVYYEDSQQTKVCNNCSLVDLGLVVHLVPQTSLPLYVSYSTTYIPISNGLKWHDVYTDDACVEILNGGGAANGEFLVQAKISCRPASGNATIAVRYEPLKLGEWEDVAFRYSDSGNWDLLHKQFLTVKVKEHPYISGVFPSQFAPGQVITLIGNFDQYADGAKVAFRSEGNHVPADLGEILETTSSSMTIRVPQAFQFPTSWKWYVFVLFKENEESELDWRLSNWVQIMILENKTYSPLIIR